MADRMCPQGEGKAPPGVCPGDRLFKVNGDSTELMSLEAAWSFVARATRPVMLHFLGPVSNALGVCRWFAVWVLNDRAGCKRPDHWIVVLMYPKMWGLRGIWCNVYLGSKVI